MGPEANVSLWKDMETDRRADPGRRSREDEKVRAMLLEAKGHPGPPEAGERRHSPSAFQRRGPC